MVPYSFGLVRVSWLCALESYSPECPPVRFIGSKTSRQLHCPVQNSISGLTIPVPASSHSARAYCERKPQCFVVQESCVITEEANALLQHGLEIEPCRNRPEKLIGIQRTMTTDTECPLQRGEKERAAGLLAIMRPGLR